MTPSPVIVRRNASGEVDDVVLHCGYARLERMAEDCVWVAFQSGSDQRLSLFLRVVDGRIVIEQAEPSG